MRKYRKKPVVIEAVQWLGNQRAMHKFMPGVQLGLTQYDPDVPVPGLIIPTLEGDMTASEGDYIIKGIAGEFYPVKEDIFHLTYEAVDE